MIEQLPLAGFECPSNTFLNQTGLFRRQSDQSHGNRSAGMRRAPVQSSNQTQHDTPLVSVFTLGRFSLLLNGKPAEFGRKVPRRPLELLKTIIALGGREVSTASLMSELWPDVDGDAAQRSFDTTLHRLRKMMGDDRVLVLRDGKLSLDGRYCWVDVWAFERLLGQSQRLLMQDLTGKQVFGLQQLTENLIGLYQDHFLANEEMTSWSVSVRERLRSKFIHHLLEVGRYMEKHGYWKQAMHCYRKGIDVDDLVEAVGSEQKQVFKTLSGLITTIRHLVGQNEPDLTYIHKASSDK